MPAGPIHTIDPAGPAGPISPVGPAGPISRVGPAVNYWAIFSRPYGAPSEFRVRSYGKGAPKTYLQCRRHD